MFTAPNIHGSTGLKGLDRLATFGSLAMLPTAFTASFGRIARSYPAMPRGRARLVSPAFAMSPVSPVSAAQVVRREGLAATGARLFARALAWLALAAERRGQQWAKERERRLTEHALRQLDSRTLRDIGLTCGEIPSMAAEAARQVEATRLRVWREIACRVV
ncbi:MAG: DUF1127 domain-containing protein [Burkholderiales bacterium]|nr:DUF1127 domain-containing protein [Burkholderiales bacterium]